MVARGFPITVPKMYFALEIGVMIRNWIFSIVGCLLLVLLVNKFVWTVYVVHGSSMEPMLYQGDLVMVKPVLKPVALDRNKVVVVSLKNEQKSIKRIVGLPGDTLVVIDFIEINTDFKAYKKPYWVKLHTKQFDWVKNGVLTAVPISTANDWLVGLTLVERENLLKRNEVKWVTSPPDFALEQASFVSLINGWTVKDFGPLVVPTIKKQLKLTSNNIAVYESLIVDEGNRLDSISAIINLNTFCYYEPKQDYIFLMGDNRGVSVDSRFFGFIPTTAVSGTFIGKLFSSNKVKVTNPISEK
jgi:signal peptidase I